MDTFLLLTLFANAVSFADAYSRVTSCPERDWHCIRVTGVEIEPYLMLDRYKNLIGLIPDLLDELTHELGIFYSLDFVPDGNYGQMRPDGSWSGMIGMLTRNKSDVGAAPLYRTRDREDAVDFTIPFLPVRATLLTKKIDSRHPLPVSVESFLSKYPSQVGTLNRGVIVRAFRTTKERYFSTLWQDMVKNRHTSLTDTNKAGVEKVRSQNYSFILPHTIGEYLALQEPCDLMTVDRFLMNRGYSLVIRKDLHSLDVGHLNRGLKSLEKRGILADLYQKWWQEYSPCQASTMRFRKDETQIVAAFSGGLHCQSPSVFFQVFVCIYFIITFLC